VKSKQRTAEQSKQALKMMHYAKRGQQGILDILINNKKKCANRKRVYFDNRI
jgi:hypothetical protein